MCKFSGKIRNLAWFLMIGFCLSPGAEARADFEHALTYTSIAGDVVNGQPTVAGGSGQYGSASAVEHVYKNTNSGAFTGRAQAYSGTYDAWKLDPPSLLSLYVEAEASRPDIYSSRGTVLAEAQFTDTFQVVTSGRSLEGYTLRFEYSVHALFQVSLTHQYNMGLRFSSFAQVPGAFGSSDDAVRFIDNGPESFAWDYANWDFATMKPIVEVPRLFEFRGRTSLDILLPSGVGPSAEGTLQIGISAYTDMSVGRDGYNQSFIDALHTGGLTGVKVIDAFGNESTPEELGWSFTFGSGMPSPNIAAVPEPASLVTSCMGLIGLWGYSRRRAASTPA